MREKDRTGWGIAILFAVIAGNGLGIGDSARAQFLPVYGGPTFDSSNVTGYKNPHLGSTAGSGVGVGYAEKYDAGADMGARAVRWDATGTATELGILGTDSNGKTQSFAEAVNSAGTAVGSAVKFDAGTDKGDRAVRWETSGAAVELGNLGTDSTGHTSSLAYAVNDTGLTVGFASKYDGDLNLSHRAVRWDPSGTTATELGNLGTGTIGVVGNAAVCDALAVNNGGLAVGEATKFDAGILKGKRAVRWDPAGTLATELGNLGTDANGMTFTGAFDVNDAGIIIGSATKYVAGSSKGSRAVRWDPSSIAATELGNLGTDGSGVTASFPYAINNTGMIVGYATKYVAGSSKGNRAVRWDASGTVATEFGNLGTDSTGFTDSRAYGVNESGLIVGYAWESGKLVNKRAVLWGQDGAAINLNTLIDPASGWVNLSEARAVSDDNWVTGIGSFDPDGSGPLPAYTRAFLMQVPEPASASAFALGAMFMLTRRKARGRSLVTR